MAGERDPLSGTHRLSDTRLRVLALLYEGKYGPTIAQELDVTRQAVYRHIRELEADGLVVEDPVETDFYRRSLGGGTSIKVYGLTDEGSRSSTASSAGARSPETPRKPFSKLFVHQKV
jgi:predicted ArsR family transcriptional regulator